MCGIAGHFAYRSDSPALDREALLRTRDSMTARGPDDAGLWITKDGRLGLAHRRLAIIDLSEAGSQPMTSVDGRYAVTFNGEIYNYRELRADLEKEGVVFRSRSDTEVLLHLYRRDKAAMVEKLRGMFAFAMWDDQEQTLFLARDPHGIKPLYYADDGKIFRFASQISALKAGGHIDLSPDSAGTVSFLLWGSVSEPFTLYRGIRLLTSGSTLRVSEKGIELPYRYWQLAQVMQRSRVIASAVPDGEEKEVLRAALLDSVRAHLLADVPVGAFLSAGLDSSSLVGLAREAFGAPLQTMTLSFDNFRGTKNDECPLATQIAKCLDVAHRCIRLPSDEQESELDAFFNAMDQPTIDGINTWFVTKAAVQSGLKVAISGLGGDELLGGYSTFQRVPDILRYAHGGSWRHFPRLYRRGYMAVASIRCWSPNEAGIYEFGQTPEGAYQLAKGVFMPWELPHVMHQDALEEGLYALTTGDAALTDDIETLNPFEQVAYLESSRYMRNQLLRDADWVSMAHSLEFRVPLVDSRLTEAVIGLAAAGRLAGGKAMLNTVLSRTLPQEVLMRPKTGFTTPTWKWLRHHPALTAWKRIPLLTRRNIRDPRRMAYAILSSQTGMSSLLR